MRKLGQSTSSGSLSRRRRGAVRTRLLRLLAAESDTAGGIMEVEYDDIEDFAAKEGDEEIFGEDSSNHEPFRKRALLRKRKVITSRRFHEAHEDSKLLEVLRGKKNEDSTATQEEESKGEKRVARVQVEAPFVRWISRIEEDAPRPQIQVIDPTTEELDAIFDAFVEPEGNLSLSLTHHSPTPPAFPNIKVLPATPTSEISVDTFPIVHPMQQPSITRGHPPTATIDVQQDNPTEYHLGLTTSGPSPNHTSISETVNDPQTLPQSRTKNYVVLELAPFATSISNEEAFLCGHGEWSHGPDADAQRDQTTKKAFACIYGGAQLRLWIKGEGGGGTAVIRHELLTEEQTSE
ncbi:hypothetical protein FRB96_006746 [Tulasnella sp. 330]|nr:hypothetical protein FRB96_006746 [Tulasnella sp. 330]